MWLLVGIAILVVVLAPLALAIARGNELFVIEVSDGELRFKRGRIPPRLLDEIRDVVKLSKLQHATIRVVVNDARPRLEPHAALSEGTAQQLRNVIAQFKTAQIRAGTRPK